VFEEQKSQRKDIEELRSQVKHLQEFVVSIVPDLQRAQAEQDPQVNSKPKLAMMSSAKSVSATAGVEAAVPVQSAAAQYKLKQPDHEIYARKLRQR